MPCVVRHLSVVWTTPQIVGLLLCRHWRGWKQFAQYMVWIIINSFKQPLIAFLHQLDKVWQIWWAVSTSLAPAKERLDALFVCVVFCLQRVDGILQRLAICWKTDSTTKFSRWRKLIQCVREKSKPMYTHSSGKQCRILTKFCISNVTYLIANIPTNFNKIWQRLQTL